MGLKEVAAKSVTDRTRICLIDTLGPFSLCHSLLEGLKVVKCVKGIPMIQVFLSMIGNVQGLEKPYRKQPFGDIGGG